MALRLGGLADLDPSAVPLPAGTEVTTRVDRGLADGKVRAIKRGEMPMPEVMALARELTPRLETARQTSPLPRHPDVALADRVLRAARDEAARRWVTRAPGPWGEAAAPPPEARYDE